MTLRKLSLADEAVDHGSESSFQIVSPCGSTWNRQPRDRLVEQGDHAALLAEGGLYAELFEWQFLTEERDRAVSVARALGERLSYR